MDGNFMEQVEKSPLLRRVFRRGLERHYREKDQHRDGAFIDRLRARNFAPEAVLIQISRRCNLRCAMCGWAVWKRNSGFMTEELYRHILAEMRVNNITQAHITNPQGEPLLHPQALEYLRIALDDGLMCI
jgi:MoaA/NifB/PqqE/SkfB family radical SAM enzyme